MLLAQSVTVSNVIDRTSLSLRGWTGTVKGFKMDSG